MESPGATMPATHSEPPPVPPPEPVSDSPRPMGTTRAHPNAYTPYSARQKPSRSPNEAHVDAKRDALFVKLVKQIRPFLQPKGEQLLAWAELVEMAQISGLCTIKNARGAMNHFNYLRKAATHVTHPYHKAITGVLRDDLLACLEMMASPTCGGSGENTTPPSVRGARVDRGAATGATRPMARDEKVQHPSEASVDRTPTRMVEEVLQRNHQLCMETLKTQGQILENQRIMIQNWRSLHESS